MRSRTKSDETRGQQREGHEERQKEQPKDAERSRDVRVPKIQYRFLKELEERPLTPKEMQSAYDMAQKIRRYPLGGQQVMSSWERFTKTAIEEYKAGTGDNDARDQQHRAYAMLFTALNGRGARDHDELKRHINNVSARFRPERSVTEKLPPREEKKEAQRDSPVKEVPRTKEGRTATQRTLALPEQSSGNERAELDARVDKMLGKLRTIPAEMRAAIEGTAIDMLVDGFHTQKTARADLKGAVEALRHDKNAANTVNALTLATIARVPTYGVLLDEIRQKNSEEQKEIVAEARKRLERYPALESGVSLVHRDQIAAAVHDVLEPSMESHKEALVLARARVELEAVADPKRFSWERIAAEIELVSEPG